MEKEAIMEVTSIESGMPITVEKKVALKGVIATPFEYEYSIGKKVFYKGIVSVLRNSGFEDLIPVIAESSLLEDEENEAGYSIVVCGNIRTRNYQDEAYNKRRLDVFVYASELMVGDYIGVEREVSEDEDREINNFEFEGFICKPPILRNTPKGKCITDVSIAVNRSNANLSDYLPCIFWGANALQASELNVGDGVKCRARFQSREYIKRYSDDTEETRTAYEISVYSFEATGESNAKTEDVEE